MGLFCVYVHTNKVNGKKYVGITSQDVVKRWKNGNGYYQNAHFYRAIQKYGWDNFEHVVVKTSITKDEACELEKNLILKYHSNDYRYGYNRSTGGENPASGITHTTETKMKMSDAHKGVAFSEEHKKHMSEAAKKRGNGRTGKTGAMCMKSGIVQQIDMETGEVIAEFYGYPEMQEKTGFSISPVKRAANGKQRQSYGYLWNYTIRRSENVAV